MSKNVTKYLGTEERVPFKAYNNIYLVGWEANNPTPCQVMALAFYAIVAKTTEHQFSASHGNFIASTKILHVKPDDRDYQEGKLLSSYDVAILGEMNVHHHAQGAILTSDFIYKHYANLNFEQSAKFLDANLFGELLSIEGGYVNLEKGEVNIYGLINSIIQTYGGLYQGMSKYPVVFCMNILNGYLNKHNNMMNSNIISVVHQLHGTLTGATPANLTLLKGLIQLGLEQNANTNNNEDVAVLYEDTIEAISFIIKDKIDNPFLYEPTDKQRELGTKLNYTKAVDDKLTGLPSYEDRGYEHEEEEDGQL